MYKQQNRIWKNKLPREQYVQLAYLNSEVCSYSWYVEENKFQFHFMKDFVLHMSGLSESLSITSYRNKEITDLCSRDDTQ